MKLSKNFSLEELTQSQTALRNNIDNTPNEVQIANLEELVLNILQPLRDYYEAPVKITSGFRSPELCVAIGSSTNSQHAKGEAADFEIPGVSNKELADWIHANLVYDQLILEFFDGKDPNSGWVHCSHKGNNNRKQYLIAYKDENNKTKYAPANHLTT